MAIVGVNGLACFGVIFRGQLGIILLFFFFGAPFLADEVICHLPPPPRCKW
jgi:hypothetical protein